MAYVVDREVANPCILRYLLASNDDEPTDWLDDTGFEIAAHVPEPGVALTLTLGLAGFTLPMRRRDRDRAASEKP